MRKLLQLAALFTLACTLVRAQAPVVRPRITGISHAGFFVSDLPTALVFWQSLLGFDESPVPDANGTNARVVFLQINDHQQIELFNEPPATPHNMLSNICFAVDDVEQMRTYLHAEGIEVIPAPAGNTRTADYAFEIRDPDGVRVEFVQSLPRGSEATAGKFLPKSRISDSIYHVGFLVGNSERSLDFYGRILGFKETWRGPPEGTELSWINMRVPDGTDYVEFMLYRSLGDPSGWGVSNHLALSVPNMDAALATLKARPAFASQTKPAVIRIGKNGKRQLNLYDPDGTRVELMEPFTLTGEAVPSSTLPPPPPSHP